MEGGPTPEPGDAPGLPGLVFATELCGIFWASA